VENFLSSFIFMFIAELGDKTQLLALSFATRSKPLYIILAVIISTLLSHILAVGTGHILAITLPDLYSQIIACIFFIFFGIYELFSAFTKNNTTNKATTCSFFSMLIAFFIVEMGDKSQFATMTLSMKYKMPFIVLIGSTLGIVIADALAIYLGSVVGKKVNKKIVRLISCVIFLAFGLSGLFLILN
jgi:putative Ca2+/H+ antiporter (TMEM165/GDT1 family)